MSEWSAITRCRACDAASLSTVVSLGWLPLANDYVPAREAAPPLTFYPHDMLKCGECGLVQLGITAPSSTVFPASYPYSSSTTKALRDNFTELAEEVSALHPMSAEDLVLDIGGNDGNLLSNFVNHRVLNVTPEDIGRLGVERGIEHLQAYWTGDTARDVATGRHGPAKLITATNVFAHVPDIHDFLSAVEMALLDRGLFVIEAQYLGALLKGVQYDHLYVEHQMFHSVESIRNLLSRHGLTIAFSREIDSHGGSIRVYAARPDYAREIASRVLSGAVSRARMLTEDYIQPNDFDVFAKRVAESKRELWRLLSSIKELGGRIFGIGAPSRASTLINYVGIDHTILDCICETEGSHKLGKFMPGTKIEVVPEARLYEVQPDYACLLSWHIASELMPKIRERGFKGRFIVPLPTPRVVQ